MCLPLSPGRRRVLVLVICSWSTAGVAALAVAPTHAAELIGHWRFAGGQQASVEDRSGAGRVATLRLGERSTAPASGPLELDGYFEHGEITDTRHLQFPDGVAITAWIRPSRLKRNTVIFGYPNEKPSWTTPALGLFVPETDRVGFGLWTQPKTVLVAPQPTTLRSWTFIAGTCDRQVARLFVNGECISEAACRSQVPTSDSPLMIGTGTLSNPFYSGAIGELRLYHGALTPREIQALYAADVSRYPPDTRLVAAQPAGISVRSKRSPADPWREYPTRTLKELERYEATAQPPQLSRYGGWLAKQTTATGFFRAERINGRWWLIDPEGHYFIHIGVCTVTPGSSANMKRALTERFGTRERWADDTAQLLRAYQFNGTGGWSANDAFLATDRPFPYIMRLSFMSSFGHQLGVTHAVPGHTGFELECIPVFHPDFPAFCAEHARQLDQYRNDSMLLGIYSDNELQTPKLENYLRLDPHNPAQRPNYEAAVKWLQQRKGTASVAAADITAMDRLEFAGYVFERYFAIVSQAIKTHAPNHLYIGSRFMRPNFANPFIWKAAQPHCDVVSVNYYGTWGPDLEEVAYWQSICPRPILITEFYVKGEDSGLPNTTGAGWIVPTQTDRGRFYQHYVLGLLESGCCVGWHWFKYQDNDPADTKAELSNIDSNKGIVTMRYEPYETFLEMMGAVNRNVYPLTEFFDR